LRILQEFSERFRIFFEGILRTFLKVLLFGNFQKVLNSYKFSLYKEKSIGISMIFRNCNEFSCDFKSFQVISGNLEVICRNYYEFSGIKLSFFEYISAKFSEILAVFKNFEDFLRFFGIFRSFKIFAI
jgi:hypothetical protein